jgi:hypothetical protein
MTKVGKVLVNSRVSCGFLGTITQELHRNFLCLICGWGDGALPRQVKKEFTFVAIATYNYSEIILYGMP